MKPAAILKYTIALCIAATLAQALHAQTPAQQTIAPLTQAIKANPKNASAWFKRGNAYYKLGKYDLAVSDLTQSLTLDPDNTKATRSRGNAYYKLNNLDSAIIDFSEVLEDSADDKGVLQLRGDAYRVKNEYRASAQDYSDFIDIDTTKDEVFYNRGVDYYKLGKYDSAIADFNKALAIQHGNNTLYSAKLILALLANDYYAQAALQYKNYQQKKAPGYLDKPEYLFVKNYIEACTQYMPNNDYTNALPALLACRDAFKPIANDEKADSIELAQIIVKAGTVYQRLDSINKALDCYIMAKGINSNVQEVNKKILLAKDIVRINTTPPLVVLDSPSVAATSRGQYISAKITKKHTIYVKGTAKAPAGIGSITVNGAVIASADSTGVFETYISDTSSTIRIQALSKKNVLTDTSFQLAKTTSIADIPSLNTTDNYYAIFIANTEYSGGKWHKLESTITEAEEFKKLLVDEYSFLPENIDTVYNKPKSEIMRAINNRLKTLGENDNVLIFYGGHGDKDDQTGTAFWVPINTNDQYDYISNQDVNLAISKTAARHVLIMADACFSSLMRSGDEEPMVTNTLPMLTSSRQLLTSGNAETVPGVSVFIPTIISTLKINPSPYISAVELWHGIFDGVRNGSHKEPILKELQVINSNGGQFYFKRRSIQGLDSTQQAEKLKAKQLLFSQQLATRDSLIKAGLAYKTNYRVDEAMRMFKDAVSINPEPSNTYAQNLYDEVNKLHSLSPEQLYKSYIDTAEMYENKRQHDAARNMYMMLRDRYPAQKDALTAQISAITEKLNFINNMQENYFKFSTFKDGAKECSNMIKKHKDDPEYYYWRGKSYAKLGDHYYDDALTDFKKAVELQPTFKEAIREMAGLYRDNNKKKEAILAYNSYIGFDKDPQVYMELFKLHRSPDINFMNEAIQDLSSAIIINPSYKEAYFNRGLLLYQVNKDYKKAFDDFNSAVQLDSLNAETRYWRGTCYLNFNQLQQASADYIVARNNKLDNVYVESINYYGDSINKISIKYNDDHLYDSAISAVNRAILINPISPLFRYEKGDYYYSLNHFSDAITSYDTAITLRNDYQEALYKRGMAWYNLGKYNNAITNFSSLVQLNPLAVMGIKANGDAYFALNNYDSSIAIFERALKTINDNKSVQLADSIKSAINNSLGYSYYMQKNNDQAITALKRAIKLDENNAQAYYNISQCYALGGDVKNAALNIDKATGFTGYANNYTWNFAGGNIYKDKNEYGKAITYYTAAIQNDKDQKLKAAWYYRGYCYSKNSNFAEAANDYINAINNKADTARTFYNELGKIYLNLSAKDSAYLFYNKSFSRDSSDENAAAAYGMASALFLQNKIDESLPLFEKAFKAKYAKNDIKTDTYYDKFADNKAWKSLYKKYY